MGADQRGSTPTPVIPSTWGADGNSITPVSSANPLPVIPGTVAPATTDDASNTTLGPGASRTWAANPARKSLLIVNTGATNSLYIKAAATADNTGFELKPGAGIKYTADEGSAQKQRTIFSTGGTAYSYEEVV